MGSSPQKKIQEYDELPHFFKKGAAFGAEHVHARMTWKLEDIAKCCKRLIV